MNNNNRVELIGELATEFEFSHEDVRGVRYFKAYMDIERLSGVYDTLPIIVSEVNLPEVVAGRLMVLGSWRSMNVPDGKKKLVHYVYADSIAEAEFNDDTNEITIVGYVGKEPIFRKTPLGRAICDCLIAVNRENSRKSDYLPCVVWGNNAVWFSKLSVGTKVEIKGRVQSREYTKVVDDVTEKRTAYEVSIGRVRVIEEV